MLCYDSSKPRGIGNCHLYNLDKINRVLYEMWGWPFTTHLIKDNRMQVCFSCPVSKVTTCLVSMFLMSKNQQYQTILIITYYTWLVQLLWFHLSLEHPSSTPSPTFSIPQLNILIFIVSILYACRSYQLK